LIIKCFIKIFVSIVIIEFIIYLGIILAGFSFNEKLVKSFVNFSIIFNYFPLQIDSLFFSNLQFKGKYYVLIFISIVIYSLLLMFIILLFRKLPSILKKM